MSDRAERPEGRRGLRNRILLTLLVIVVFRLGQNLPTPNVNVRALAGIPKADNHLHWVLDLFTGGALLKLSVFAFGIFPCLAATMVLRTLINLIPRLAALKAEGEAGARLLTQYRRRLTVGLGLLGAVGVVAAVAGHTSAGAAGQGRDILDDHGVLPLAVMVVCMTAGTALVMWLAEAITDRGFGDGVRILLLAQVVAVLPAEFLRLCQAKGGAAIAVMTVVALSVVVVTIFVAQAQRRIPVQYAREMVGRRPYGGASSYVPLRIPQSNGPAVLASVLLYLPVLATQFWPDAAWLKWAMSGLHDEGTPWRMAAYFVLVCLFAFLRAAGTIDPDRLAHEIARVGGFVPGVRPGRPTAQYLGYVHHRIIAVGSVYLGGVALIPALGLALLDAGPQFPFGGVTMLVVLVFLVGVTLDTARQIDARRAQSDYEGLLH
jgi:preprotein translocase subunit SecY